MKKKTNQTSRISALVLLLAFAGATQFPLSHQANAQDRTINVNERLDLRALGINNEVQQINSLLGVQAKFFKKALDLNDKVSISLDEKTQLQNEAVQRKSDVTTLKNQFLSLINNLKQKNNWNEAFDAQFLASLKNSSDRTLLTQAGGARKLLEAGAADFDGLRDHIEQEVRQVSNRQAGRVRSRGDRVYAAHASAPLGNFGCAALLASYILATATGNENSISCAVSMLYNRRGCKPGIVSGAACH
jgi:hypothetical protein